LFTGGADVDPSFYNETSPKNYCRSDATRDTDEAMLFSEAVEAGIKCVGICRGLQFLNVMNGGRMIHHLSGHEGGKFHGFETPTSHRVIRVNSLHHQMIIPPKECFVIGWSPVRESVVYIGDKDESAAWPGPEIEAAYYPKTGCAGVQYHPEMMDAQSEGYKWFRGLVHDLVYMTHEEFTVKYVRSTDNVLQESTAT